MEKANEAIRLGWRVLAFTPQQVKSGMALKAIEDILSAWHSHIPLLPLGQQRKEFDYVSANIRLIIDNAHRATSSELKQMIMGWYFKKVLTHEEVEYLFYRFNLKSCWHKI